MQQLGSASVPQRKSVFGAERAPCASDRAIVDECCGDHGKPLEVAVVRGGGCGTKRHEPRAKYRDVRRAVDGRRIGACTVVPNGSDHDGWEQSERCRLHVAARASVAEAVA
eukprot:3704745-Prymnesium_polylepis.2